MKTQKVRVSDARKLAETLINECDPENLAEFLDKYLNDSDVGFVYKGDDYLIAYMYSEDGEKFIDELLKNDSNDFSACKNGEDFEDEKKEKRRELPFPECFKYCSAVELLGVGECENVCPEKFKEKNDGETGNF